MDARPSGGFLTSRRLAVLLALTCALAWTSTMRLMDPVGEREIPFLNPGSADFFIGFAATKAFLLGENPYHHDVRGLADPWGREAVIDGKTYRIVYPPSHFLLYVPLALITQDTRRAGRLLFGVNLVAVLGLATMTWWLLARTLGLGDAERRQFRVLMPLLFVLLVANPGTGLTLERGQSDILVATLLWGAVACASRRWWGLSTFLLAGSTLIKGYAVLVSLGLGLLLLERRRWPRALAGGCAALAVFVLPVAAYVPDAITPLLWRADLKLRPLWVNHSFWTVFWHLSPAVATTGRMAMGGLALLVTGVSWLRLRRALAGEADGPLAFWLVLFTTMALIATIGTSRTSFIYNLPLLLPGLLVLLVAGVRSSGGVALARGETLLFGIAEVATGALLFAFRGPSRTLSLTGIGLIAFVLLAAAAVAREGRPHALGPVA
jgi:hypothetical protein